MPNWCNNHIVVRGTDQREVQRLADAFDAGQLLNAVIPVPEDLTRDGAATMGGPNADAYDQIRAENKARHGYDNWYDFCTNRWGTKWDISIQQECDRSEDGLSFEGSFDTAWAPPVPVMEELVERGFEVSLVYYEPGMAFVGKFEDGCDEYFEIGEERSSTVRDAIGEELDDFWGISEQMAEYEAENEEDLTRWVKEGAEQVKKLETL